MKSFIKIITISFLFSMLLIVACKEKKSEPTTKQAIQKAAVYTCSMHPQIIKDLPGDCPICGMTLVKKAEEEDVKVDIDLNTLLKATNRFVVSSHPVDTPQRGE